MAGLPGWSFALEGQLKIAQQFIAGTKEQVFLPLSPGGTIESNHRKFSRPSGTADEVRGSITQQ